MSLHRLTRIGLLGASLLLFAASCGRPTSGNADTEDGPLIETRRAVLANLADNVFIAQYEDFQTKNQALHSATEAWQASGSEADRVAAQEAWRAAMDSWQHAELYQMGPAGRMGEVAGGEDLRDVIYSWPLSNPCRVDQELLNQGYASSEKLSQQLVNSRGLDALEYLLFHDSERNACAPNAPLNAPGAWDQLTVEELTTRRAAYAVALTQDIGKAADALVAAWREDGQDFRAELAGAGQSSAAYPTSQEALNAISDALFYLEKETKDMKLAVPLGLSNCSADTCPEALESRWADFSREKMLANTRAFQTAYLGNVAGEEAAPGFDDLLIAVGQDELDAQMQEALTAAITALEAIDKPLSVALVEDRAAVMAAYDALRAVGTLLKTQFVSVLDLKLPQRAEGDND